MRRALAAVVVVLGLTAAQQASAAETPAPQAPQAAPEKVAAFAEFVRQKRAEVGLPGLAVGVANRKGVVTLVRDGMREAGGSAALQPGDVYHIGSITKSMTATMIARLVERGVIGWDTTPAQIWPELAGMDPAYRRVTLEMILRHRGGLQGYETDEEVDATPKFAGDARQQRAAFAAWMLARPPANEVGKHVYSNAGYGVAAAMAEKASGRTWEELMRAELFGPLRMDSCGFGWPPRGQPRGHRFKDGKFVVHDLSDGYVLPPYIDPAGDVYCSVEDMLAYGRAHQVGAEGGSKLLKPDTWRKLHDAPPGDYALGWNTYDWGFHHSGSAETFAATLLVSPKRDVVIYFVANAAGWPEPPDIRSEIAQRAFNDFAIPKPPKTE